MVEEDTMRVKLSIVFVTSCCQPSNYLSCSVLPRVASSYHSLIKQSSRPHYPSSPRTSTAVKSRAGSQLPTLSRPQLHNPSMVDFPTFSGASQFFLRPSCFRASTDIVASDSCRAVLLKAVAMFTVFSLACALAQTMLQLIIFRGFQGIFGGGLFTMVMIVMSDLISLKDRGKYVTVPR